MRLLRIIRNDIFVCGGMSDCLASPRFFQSIQRCDSMELAMEIAIKTLGRYFIILGLISFLLLVLMGPSHAMAGMERDSDGAMGGCLFTGMVEICQMTFAEHLLQWQSLFEMTVSKNARAIVLLLGIMVVAVFVFKRHLLMRFGYYTTRWRLYVRHHPNFKLFFHLRDVFSRGILNPKVY